MSRIAQRAARAADSRRRPVASEHGPAPLAIDVEARNAAIDHGQLAADRLARFRAELVRRDYGAAVLSDPINIRYVTGARNMAVWTMHAPVGTSSYRSMGRSCCSSTRRRSTSARDSTPSTRSATASPRSTSSPDLGRRRWPNGGRADIVALTLAHAGPDHRLAVDRCEPWLARHLYDAGITLFDAQEPAEVARMIKTPEEVECMQLAMDVCDVAVERLRDALQPGVTENQLWAVLHETNIAHGGEWIECRLLSSGPRTNPWFQECGNRVIEAGDLVGFDTDMVGPNGYLADISRTLLCPGSAPTADQRRLYDIAQEQVLTNIELIRPGMSFREFSERCWPVPEEFSRTATC